MGSAEILYTLIMLIAVFISVVSQVILKKSAAIKRDSIWQEYLNAPVISAYFMLFVSTLLAVIAYRVVPMSVGTILDTSSYIFITVFGVAVFKEKLTLKKAAALLLIISGILIYSLLG